MEQSPVDVLRTRLAGLCRALELTDRVLSGRPVKLRFNLECGEDVEPAISVGSDIVVNVGTIKEPGSNAGLVSILGLNYHEVAHVRYSVDVGQLRKHAPRFELRFDEAYQILEEARIETLLSARYEKMKKYFAYPVIQFFVEDQRTWKHAFLYTHGRRYLPRKVRDTFRKMFEERYDKDTARKFADLIDAFRVLSFREDAGRAAGAGIICDFADLMDTAGLPNLGAHNQQRSQDGRKGLDKGTDQDAAEAAQKAQEQDEEEQQGADGSGFEEQESDEDFAEDEGLSEEESEESEEEEGDDGEDGTGDLADDDESADEGPDETGDPEPEDESGEEGKPDGSDGGEDSEGGEASGTSGRDDEDLDGDEDQDEESDGWGGDGGDDDQDQDDDDASPDDDLADGSGVGSGDRSDSADTSHALDDADEISEALAGVLDGITDNEEVRRDLENFRGAMEDADSLSSLLDRHPQSSLENLKPVTPEMLQEADQLREVLRQLWAQLDPGWEYGLSEGARIDMNRAALAQDAEDYDSIYADWNEGQQDNAGIEVVILVDESSSMMEPVFVPGEELLTRYEKTNRASIASKNIWELMYPLQEIEAAVTALTFSYSARTLYDRNDRVTTAGYANIHPSGGTNPTMAVIEARRILTMSEMPHKLLIAVTDGQWSNSETISEALDAVEGAVKVAILIGAEETQFPFTYADKFDVVARTGGKIFDIMAEAVVKLTERNLQR